MATKPKGGGGKGLSGWATKKRTFFLRLPLTNFFRYSKYKRNFSFSISAFIYFKYRYRYIIIESFALFMGRLVHVLIFPKFNLDFYFLGFLVTRPLFPKNSSRQTINNVMQSDRNSLGGEIVLDRVNRAYKDEDCIFEDFRNKE